MFDYYSNNLAKSLSKLQACVPLSAIEATLKIKAAVTNRELIQAINTEIPAFTASRNPDLKPQLKSHICRHTEIIWEMLTNSQLSKFDFVRKYNQQLARQYFPLENSLHAYRICHKFYSRRLRDTLIQNATDQLKTSDIITAVNDFILEYTDVVSTLATESYIEQTRIMTAAAGDKRAELLSVLLGGFDESDGRVSNLLLEAGYLEDGLLFCVAVAQSVEPTEMLNHERARRMADSIDKLFRNQPQNQLVDVRDNKVVIIFSDQQRMSGWTEPHQGLAEQVSKQLALVGNAAYIGVSSDIQSTSQIPKAYQQAIQVLKLATPTRRVVSACRLSIRELLLQSSAQQMRHSLPQWAEHFYLADNKSKGALSSTLRAYAKTSMNILKAGAVLSVHPNTIYSRFQKIYDITGHDAKRFEALNELLLICDVRDTQ